ncbi:MAG: anthranilate phosphoribosyltransferase [Thermincola sp.]|jgi:anthranilate phosphoribosyltransferase|nr:anthranilate phosphoribosyltransferase [Thermincola sp.]MDT3703746.1 anthranilate phosphoribosyltransferase [Thermincola sp.]
MFKEAINKVVNGTHLTEEEAVAVMDYIMSGKATDAQIGAFITALRIKGETVDEITGFAKVMREKATRVTTSHSTLIDIVGTGADGSNTFNVSTTVSLMVAAAGVPVAKHGNRSVSSRCGSADVLEALDLNINLTPEQVGACIDNVGIGFLFAPALHGAMKYAIGPRREIGIRTVFNILGPLTNPAGAQHMVVGVYDPNLTEVLAGVLANLGTSTAVVCHGAGGLDEVSNLGPTKISEVKNGKITTYYLDPQKHNFSYSTIDQLRGGTAQENAKITRSILQGEQGPRRDIVLLNTALSLVVAGAAEDVDEGVAKAAAVLDSGAALEKLNELIKYSQRLAQPEASAG